MELYFTRHGRTEWNKELRFQGSQGDSPLLLQSYQEIKELGGFIREGPFEAIYTSDAKRAQDTAQGINACLANPVPIIVDPGLRELGLGELEGQLIREMQVKYPQEMQAMREKIDEYDPSPFKGETFPDAIQRIEAVVLKAVKQAQQGPLLFVGHGASLTAAVQAMAGKPLAEARAMGGLKNNSLSIMETQNKQLPFELVRFNDVSFLSDSDELISIP